MCLSIITTSFQSRCLQVPTKQCKCEPSCSCLLHLLTTGTPHPVAISGNHGRKHAVSGLQTQTAAPNSSKSGVHEEAAGDSEQKKQADLLFPFLEWWALAHSRFIIVRRGENLKAAGSTYSGTAHLYGGWLPR